MSEPVNALDNAVLLNLSIGMPGNSKRVQAESVLAEGEASPEHSWLSVSKRLLDSKEFDAIRTVTGLMKRYVTRKCIVAKAQGGEKPALRRFIKSGVYVLPVGLVSEVDAKLGEFKDEFSQAVEKFLEAYPALREEAKVKLKGVFDAQDYPPVEAVRRAFYVDVGYLSISTPKALESISAELFAREQEKAKKQWSEASQEIKLAMRAGLQELVSWMADTLKPTPGSRQKAFRASGVERLMEFCQDFASKDIVGDAQLADLVVKVKDILGGADVESLQKSAKSDDWREEMSQKFDEVKTELQPLVEEAAGRVITLED